MAKASVGDVYAKVIRDVCEHSRTDFEEGGVDLSTLDLLRSEWQKKLSGLKVTELPWDPKGTAALKEANGGPNVKSSAQTLPSNGIGNSSSQSSLNTLPPIKTESGSYPPQPPPSNYAPPNFPQGQPLTAQQRAAMNLHNVYGDRAGAQIAELQHGVPRSAPPNQQPNQSGPYIKQEETSSDSYHSTHPHQPGTIKADQTDGAGEARDTWQSEYARRKSDIAINRDRNDSMIRDHVTASQQRLEGGGVLRPLHEHVVSGRLSRSQISRPNETPWSLGRAQGDATGDDEDDEEDEDAINSDLDDPDDLENEAADGEDTTDQVMLCTYDKVQRVKNKWKCTLKDGILRVDGSELLFHKGNGEFEW